MANKQVLDRLGLNGQLLLSQPPAQGLVAQGRVLDLFDQDRNRFKRGWLPSMCAPRATALLLSGVNGPIGTVVDESTLRLLSLDLRMIGKGRKKRARVEPEQ